MLHTKDMYHDVKTVFDENKSFDSRTMLEDAINYQLINHSCLNFVYMSKYGDHTHCENLDCGG